MAKLDISDSTPSRVVANFRHVLRRKHEAALPPRPQRTGNPFTCRVGRRYVTSGWDAK